MILTNCPKKRKTRKATGKRSKTMALMLTFLLALSQFSTVALGAEILGTDNQVTEVETDNQVTEEKSLGVRISGTGWSLDETSGLLVIESDEGMTNWNLRVPALDTETRGIVISVEIASSVTSIPAMAFSECVNLKTVTFGENSQLTKIERNAFQDAKSLTKITIPDSVTSIGGSAFLNCDALETVIFGENSQLTEIGSNAFNGCLSLIEITIPEGVTSIERNTFLNCISLTEITIPDSVTSIGESAFAGCDALETVIFGENSQLTEIGTKAFSMCFSLTEITIPDSVTSLGGVGLFKLL
ncbi:MAG: leucine-rich repeat domain-containing protein [Clostridiales bacterium]|nr:leucine-rich repeat domain-containing protein [Clostridiales bacterium]